MEEPIFTPPFINIEYFFNKIYLFFKNAPETMMGITDSLDFSAYVDYLHTALSIISIILITGIIYSIVRIYEIRKEEEKRYHFSRPVKQQDGRKSDRWEIVENHINSTNPAEWRMAIIEADSILDDMVKKLGYEGEDLGERLKSADANDFNSVNSAWEAHKVRNKIAHEGASFEINHREARRVISLYEKVFKEFDYI